MVDLKYILDTSASPVISGTVQYADWSSVFYQTMRAGGLSYLPSCSAIAIGKDETIKMAQVYILGKGEHGEVLESECDNTFVGRKLSIDVEDVQVEHIFAQISLWANLNFVLSANVKGRVTVHVNNIPWDELLKLIFATFGLGDIQHGNVILVGPKAEIAEEAKRLRRGSQIEFQ